MSYASSIVNRTSLINAAGEKAVKVDTTPQKPVNHKKDNTGNKKELTPQLNLRELEMALTKAVRNTRFSYRVNDNIDMIIVKIIDKNTDEVIKEIPGEEIQKLHENLQKAIGLLFDTQI
jgi:flagellar protein FlaG